jgi:hypothetical protein
MVTVTTDDHVLSVDVSGVDKLWSLRSHLEIPMENVVGVHRPSDQSDGWWAGFRAAGTRVPGVIKAGTFHRDGKRIFFDVHDPDKTLVFDLKDDDFNELVVEVADPEAVVTEVEAALRADGSAGIED